MALILPPGQSARNMMKFGTAAITHYVKQFTDGRITAAALEKVVDHYASSLSEQIVDLATVQKAQSVLATARHGNVTKHVANLSRQVMNLTTQLKTQGDQLVKANEILEKLNPEMMLDFFKNMVTVTLYLKVKQIVYEFLSTTKGKITVALMILLIVRAFDTVILGGLLTQGTVKATKASFKATRYLFKKISGTKSLVKKLVYSAMAVVSMKSSKKKSPIKFNSRPVFNVTKRSRKQTVPKRSALN